MPERAIPVNFYQFLHELLRTRALLRKNWQKSFRLLKSSKNPQLHCQHVLLANLPTPSVFSSHSVRLRPAPRVLERPHPHPRRLVDGAVSADDVVGRFDCPTATGVTLDQAYHRRDHDSVRLPGVLHTNVGHSNFRYVLFSKNHII